jgi:hypothetical protein
MKTLLVGFGDSWTFGAELPDPSKQNWVVQMADKLGTEYVNCGTCGSSVGHLILQLFSFVKISKQYSDYKKIFIVGLTSPTRYLSYSNRDKEFVNITTGGVYLTSDYEGKLEGRPPVTTNNLDSLPYAMYSCVESPEYSSFTVAQTVFSFQEYCKNNNIDCVFFSYWDAANLEGYSDVIDTTKVYPGTLVSEMTGIDFYDPKLLSHPYFVGNAHHPNLAGQTRMTEIIYDYYISTYPRN